MEIIIVVFSVLIFLLYFVYRRIKSCIVIFKGQKFIVPYKDKNCAVMHFDSMGTYRKDEGGNWYPENRFNLAEWTWADIFNRKYFFIRFSEIYLKFFSSKFYVSIVLLYFSLISFLAIFPDKLENYLIPILFFWISILATVVLKEFILHMKNKLIVN
jgi:hypothetical protein